MRRNKKGALELSIGTIVILVIAMSMLVLGIILVNKILGGATDSVDILNEQVKGEITALFAEEGSTIGIRLGADKTATIQQGDRIGIAFGAEAKFPTGATDEDMEYRFELMENPSEPTCQDNFKDYFLDYKFTNNEYGENPGSDYTSDRGSRFEEFEGGKGYSIIVFDIPDEATPCEQRIKIHLYDQSDPSDSEWTDDIAIATFRVKVISSGIF